VTGALARRADHILDELKVDERQVRRLFMELVRVTDTLDQDARRPRSKAELDALDTTLWPLAQRLAEKRLVVTTAEVTTAEPVVDVVHEALFRRWNRLRAWTAEERDFLRWRQRLDERRREWEEAGQDSRELLNSRALEEAERWLTQRADMLSDQQQRSAPMVRQEFLFAAVSVEPWPAGCAVSLALRSRSPRLGHGTGRELCRLVISMARPPRATWTRTGASGAAHGARDLSF
jgi:hypothetical protein